MFIQEFYSNIHHIDTSVPRFARTFRGRHIVVTPNLISEVLHVPWVALPNYLDCDHFHTISRDGFLSYFCKTPSCWGGKQNTPCLGFVKGPRFLNMVMTFTLTPLSHYNSFTESHPHFILSLLEDLSFDFPSHFITSILDVYKDTATHDKLIFPLVITQILRHFSIPIPISPYYTSINVIDAGSVRRSEAQLQPKRPCMKCTDPATSIIPSTSTPSSSTGDVTLEAVMAQLQCMDACLDTLIDELCQVNSCVGRIARRQACLGPFAASPSSSPETLANEDGDGDEDASSSSDNEMATSQ